jgi:hypothetical protein
LTSWQHGHSIAIRGYWTLERFAQPSPPPKITEKRRGTRMNSRVPVTIEWQDAGGGTLREQAFTRVIGPYGCLVVLPQALSVQQNLRLVNLATEQMNGGVVVWKGNQRVEGWELGIELTQPPMDFWGLEL